MTRYLLSSAVLSTPGTYTYELINPVTAREWLSHRSLGCISCIGYRVTALAFDTVLGYEPEVSRRHHTLEPGDEALVFRLRARVTNTQDKRLLDPAYIARTAEIGLLRRIA